LRAGAAWCPVRPGLGDWVIAAGFGTSLMLLGALEFTLVAAVGVRDLALMSGQLRPEAERGVRRR
jgi:hypothetical protein